MPTDQNIIQENEKRYPRSLDEPSSKAECYLGNIPLDYPQPEYFM